MWQKNYLKNQELSVFDLKQNINELGIPITYNETIGLISFANKRNTNTLNYDEFKNLFFLLFLLPINRRKDLRSTIEIIFIVLA